MTTLIISRHTIEPSTKEIHEVTDLRKFFEDKYGVWPKHARLYDTYVSVATDVTPTCFEDFDELNKSQGPLLLMLYPGEFTTIAFALLAVVLVSAVVLMPKVTPMAALRNTQTSSSNNELSARSNKPRVGGRVADIYGEVRSTPDLLSQPYTIYEDNQAVEYSYMCIGRGAYDVSDIRDDTTLISDIAGSSVEIFAPFTSPNSGDEPQLRIGAPINTPLYNVSRMNSVNGQVLRAPNDEFMRGNSNIKFFEDGRIAIPAEVEIDFTEKFAVGDLLKIENGARYASYVQEQREIRVYPNGSFKFEADAVPASYVVGKELTLTGAFFIKDPESTLPNNSYDVSGQYVITALAIEPETVEGVVTNYCRVTLESPELINPQWNYANGVTSSLVGVRLPDGPLLYDLSGEYAIVTVAPKLIRVDNPVADNPDWGLITETPYYSPTLSTSGPKYVGPFVVDKRETARLFNNVVAIQGLYKDDGKNQYPLTIEFVVEVTPIVDGVDGEPVEFTYAIQGSGVTQSKRSVTAKTELPFVGPSKIRLYRTTPKDLSDGFRVFDEIQWQDLLAVADVNEAHFGDKTTANCVTYATTGALAQKERKLNMKVCRKLARRINGSMFTTELYATKDAADIISAICLDPKIGNCSPAEVNFDSIYDAIADAKAYFGTPLATEFCYTFDKINFSFQETIKVIAEAVFCTPYRRGSIINLNFEKATEYSTLLFNHRNKLPKTEQRTKTFGNRKDNDGVELKWVDPIDDSVVTYFVPEDRSAINPEKKETIGVRNGVQAYFHAKRLWNRIRYQKKAIEFKATQEADLLVDNDRILVADNTRPDTQDGQVVEQSALEIKLSQPVDMSKHPGYVIFLQMPDKTIESIPVTQGSTNRHVVLSRPPRLPLVTAQDRVSKTKYVVVGNNDGRESHFLVSEKKSDSNFTSTVKAFNYDRRYYQNDKDLITGVINASGVIV